MKADTRGTRCLHWTLQGDHAHMGLSRIACVARANLVVQLSVQSDRWSVLKTARSSNPGVKDLELQKPRIYLTVWTRSHVLNLSAFGYNVPSSGSSLCPKCPLSKFALNSDLTNLTIFPCCYTGTSIVRSVKGWEFTAHPQPSALHFCTVPGEGVSPIRA